MTRPLARLFILATLANTLAIGNYCTASMLHRHTIILYTGHMQNRQEDENATHSHSTEMPWWAELDQQQAGGEQNCASN